MKARKILTLGFLISMLWGMLFMLTLAILEQGDRIGLILSGVSFLAMGMSTYMKLKKNQNFGLSFGYVIAALFVALSISLLWLINILRNFTFSPTVFCSGILGFLVINLSVICFAYNAQYHEIKNS